MSLSASVVVPAHEEPRHLSMCLSSLSGQDAEVIVVASDEKSRDVARNHATTDEVLTDEGRGPGAARNQGARAASGDVVLFTDADTLVPPDWVSNHRRHYEDEAVVGVGGPAHPSEGGAKDEVLFKVLSDYWYRVSWPLGLVQLPTFNCSYRTATFLEHGGFDEALPFMEDTELSLRLRREGRFVYDVTTRVSTSARRERDEGYASLFMKYARGWTQYFVLDGQVDDDYFDSVRE